MKDDLEQKVTGEIDKGMLVDEEEDLLVSQLNMDISDQYVVFSVDREEYGIAILSVQEIISLPNLTRIPGVPAYIPGIINLRGTIIPIYMLRSRFNLEEVELSNKSTVIIVQTGEDKKRTVGFIVDNVSDVVSITDENMGEPPELSRTIDIGFIKKIGKIGSRMIIIIDLSNFFTESEERSLDSVVNNAVV